RAVLLSEGAHLDTRDFSWIIDHTEPRALASERSEAPKITEETHDEVLAPTPIASLIPTRILSSAPAPVNDSNYFRIPLTVSLKELEEQYIQAYCNAHPKMSREDVATGLGINRKTLYRKFQEMRELKEGTA
ncbi:MAG: hypothetical protein ABIR96_12060, partial [Bdellovibrionota bacterium]